MPWCVQFNSTAWSQLHIVASLGADQHDHFLIHLWLHLLLLSCLRAAANCTLLPLCLLLLWGRGGLDDGAAALDQVSFPALVVDLKLQRPCQHATAAAAAHM